MAQYLARDVIRCLYEQNCEYEGDQSEIGMRWFAPDGITFILPDPQDGWFDAEVIDGILSNRWIWLCKTHRYEQ
jgi:hypothetical protein